jgi:hypothetical protein
MLSKEIYRSGFNAETDQIAIIVNVHRSREDAITLEFNDLDFQITLSVGAAESLASTIREAIGGYLRRNGTQPQPQSKES